MITMKTLREFLQGFPPTHTVRLEERELIVYNEKGKMVRQLQDYTGSLKR